MPTQFDFGLVVGLLVGEGHFCGDGRQPHVTLRMHVRHQAIFDWLQQTFPGGRVPGGETTRETPGYSQSGGQRRAGARAVYGVFRPCLDDLAVLS